MSGLVLAGVSTVSVLAQMPIEQAHTAVQNDAYALIDLIESQFAYSDRFPNGIPPVRAELAGYIHQLQDRDDLVAFSQQAFHSLYDHHSITGSGLQDAYGLVPSFADMWIEKTQNGYEILDVRKGSAALAAGIRPGCILTSVEDTPMSDAVQSFIGNTAQNVNEERLSYAARVLSTGRRDRTRRLGLSCDGYDWTLELPTLYQARLKRDKGLVSLEQRIFGAQTIAIIRFNDSLGLPQTIEAFDDVTRNLTGIDGIILDMRDTASGGNTLVARGILSRFVSKPEVYQRHVLPADKRDFGVRRSWLEEVTPRGERIALPTAILSGRWTASMGEGLTIAFDALGYPTFGSQMAGLLGGITDHRLPETNVQVKLTTERLEHVDGTAREVFNPKSLFHYADAPGPDGQDGPLNAALSFLSAR